MAKKFTPVKWIFKVNKLNECEYELLFQGQIDKNWHLYGLKSYDKNGPIPTSFLFSKDDNYTLVGHVTQSECIKELEPLWDFKVQFFKNQVEFKQKVKIRTHKSVAIKGQIKFMIGNGNQCLPPYTVDFEFDVAGTNACIGNCKISSTTSCNCDPNGISQTPALGERQNTSNDSLTKSSIDSVSHKKTLPVSEIETEETRSWWLFFLLGF